MKTLKTSLFLLLCFANTYAQSSLGKQVNDAKFQIVKKTAEFLSTDKATFGNKAKSSCDKCSSYEDVKKYAVDNSLINVNTLVNELQNTTVDTASNEWEKSLTTFKDNVVSKITTGNEKKIARIHLPGYKSYVNSLNEIINKIKTAETKPSASTSGDENPASQKPDLKAAKASDTITKANAPQQIAPDEETVPQSSLPGKIMQWLPYIIAGILLLLLLTLWRSGNENNKKITALEQEKKDTGRELFNLKNTNADLLDTIKILEEDVKNKEIDLQATEARLRNAESNKNNAAQSNAPEQPTTEKPVGKITVQKPKPVIANIKYARYADMGDGFSNAELLDKADGETIFELTLMPNTNTGEFKVANHGAAQHYALSNVQYFLGKTCQYASFPSEDATIQTDTPGTLKLTGSKWTIVSPAKISFS